MEKERNNLSHLERTKEKAKSPEKWDQVCRNHIRHSIEQWEKKYAANTTTTNSK